MALRKRKIDVPLGGGLKEDVDKRLFQPPFVRRAKDVDVTKEGAYRKRQGYEALPGAAGLPDDPDGINTPFAYRGGIHLLSRRGVFAFNETESTWHRAQTIDTTPVELERRVEIHGASSLLRFDHATDGIRRIEVWQEEPTDASPPRVWYQIRDAATGVVTVPARVIASNMRVAPRVFFADSKFWVWAFSLDILPTTINQAEIDPATGAIGPIGPIAVGFSFDVLADPAVPTQAFAAVMGAVGTNALFRWVSGLVVDDVFLSDTRTGGAIAIEIAPVADVVFVATASSAAGTGDTILSLENFLKIPLTSITSSQGIDSIVGLPDDIRVTCRLTQDLSNLFVAMSASGLVDLRFVLQPGGEGFYSNSDFGQASRMRQRLYVADLVTTPSDPFEIENCSIIGHAFKEGGLEPALALEHGMEMGGSAAGGALGGYWRTDPLPLQRFAYIARVDTETFTVDGSGVPTTTVGAFPILLARFNGGSSATTQRRDLPHLSRGYFDAGDNTHRHISAFIRELRLISHNFSFDLTTGGRHMRLDPNPGPVRVIETNDSVIINTAYLSNFDGQVMAEMSPLCSPEWVAVELIGSANAEGFITSHNPQVDDDDIMRFAVDLEVVDRIGNIHRSGPALVLGGPAETLFNFDLDTDAVANNQELDFNLFFTLPDLSMYRPEDGLGYRARVYFAVERNELVEVGLFPIEVVDIPNQSGTGFFRGGKILLDENVRMGSAVIWAEFGPPAGAAPFPWSIELLPERPPPLRDITVAANRLFAISAENPSEVLISKSVRFGRSVEWNPVLASYATAVGAAGFVSIAAIDDKVILFTTREIYVIPATSADDTGRGQPPTPMLVASDGGCINKRSVVKGPFGVMFRGQRGLYVIDRALNLQYVGGAIEDALSAEPRIQTAVLVSSKHEVRFTTDGGNVMFVYNYNRGAWSTRSTDVFGAADIRGRYVFSLNTPSGYAVLGERAADDIEYDDPSGDNVMSFETAWLRLSESIAGFGRTYKIVVAGEYHNLAGTTTPGGLRFEIFYDFDETAPLETKTELFGNDLSEGAPLSIELRLKRQKASAIKLRITEIPGTTAIGTNFRRGVTLSSITLELGVKKGLFKRPQIRG